MPATVRQYELVYIVSVDRTDEQIRATIDKYNNLIATQGGEIERTDIWERRRLAYEIKGQHEGVYIVCVFRGLPSVEAELRRVFRISEDTLRFIIVRPDEDIDTTVPAVQPSAYSGGRSQSPSTIAAAPSLDAITPRAEPATSEAGAASEAGVPEAAASNAETEAEAEPVAATA